MRARGGRVRAVVLSATVLVMAAACAAEPSPERESAGDSRATAEQGHAGTTETSPEPLPQPSPDLETDREVFEPPTRPAPAPDPERPGTCDPMTAAAIGATVTAQLDAFARSDLDAAFALTSASFRSSVDRTDFERIIRTGYAYLLGNAGHRLDTCWSSGSSGYILAGVRSAEREYVLRYDVSEDLGAGWRIDGAAELPGIALPEQRLVSAVALLRR